jgi:pimeloyl-ACP methyl ester carboxylesterase
MTSSNPVGIDDPRGRIDYDESGEGPTVVLVPGSCSTGAAWRPLISCWEDRFRCVTTSLLGYGGTAERRHADDPGIAHEAEIIEAVIRHAGAPVHLVGHSFGGLAALALALRHPELLHSLTILEAPAPEILRAAGEERHYASFRAMSAAYAAAYRGGKVHAIERMIDFYGGEGTFASWPLRVRDYAVQTTAVNLLDWESAYGFALTPSLLGAIELPTLVVTGEASHPAPRRANELIGRHVPGARFVTLPGAAHFMIATHAGETADLLAGHFTRSKRVEWMTD